MRLIFNLREIFPLAEHYTYCILHNLNPCKNHVQYLALL